MVPRVLETIMLLAPVGDDFVYVSALRDGSPVDEVATNVASVGDVRDFPSKEGREVFGVDIEREAEPSEISNVAANFSSVEVKLCLANQEGVGKGVSERV